MSQLYQPLLWVPKDIPLTGEGLKNELYGLLKLYSMVQKAKGEFVQFERLDGQKPEPFDEENFLRSAVTSIRNPKDSRKPMFVARFPHTVINNVPGIEFELGGFILDTSALAKAVGDWDLDIVPGLFTCEYYIHERFEEEEDGAAIGECKVEKGAYVHGNCHGRPGCAYVNIRFRENVPPKLADIIADVLAVKK
ncbi:hypothetical protein KY325_03685 [Candidatus Woesearchaeota archaeon]|nr:hypothetical protein [Candidatus Woesearchaeota archaeon]